MLGIHCDSLIFQSLSGSLTLWMIVEDLFLVYFFLWNEEIHGWLKIREWFMVGCPKNTLIV